MDRRPSPLPTRPQWSMRLGEAERRLIETAALNNGERLSQYIRRVAIAAARRDLAGPSPDA